MDTDPAVVMGIVAAIAAILGPIVGVAMANTFARNQSRREAAATLFRLIMEDVQNYRHAFLSEHRHRTDIDALPATLNQIDEIASKTANATDNEGKATHQQAVVFRDHLYRDAQRVQEKYFHAFREARFLESSLNADVLSLGLLFDTESKQCGQAIRDMIAMSQVFKMQPVPSFDECQQRLNELILRISQSMKLLHNSLRRTDPLSSDGCYGAM